MRHLIDLVALLSESIQSPHDDDCLEEAFDPQPIEWKSQDDDSWSGVFNIADVKVVFDFQLTNADEDWGGDWVFAFATKKADGPLSLGSNPVGAQVMHVFGGVVGVIEDFIAKMKPRSIHFSGDKSLGKANIYAKMARALTPRLRAAGYVCRKDHEDRFDHLFVIEKTW